MATPADDVRTILLQAPAVGATGTAPWTTRVSRYGLATGDPAQQIVVFDTGGAAPEPSLLLDYPTVQVQVRGAKDTYSVTAQKMIDVKDRLLGVDPQTIGGNRISGIVALGELFLLQYDESDRPIFAMNFRLFREPGASALTHRESL